VRVHWPWLLLGGVAFVPWLAAHERVRSFGEALLAGWLFAVAFELAVFAWFADGIAAYTGLGLPAAFAVLVLLAPLLQPQLLVWSLARHAVLRRARRLSAVLAGALVYVGSEWALPKLFGDTIGHGLHASRWLRQAADLGGAGLLSFALLVFDECALATGKALRRRAWRAAAAPAACAAALLLALTGYGALRLAQLSRDAGGPLLTAGIVQADISRYGELAREQGTYDAVRSILDVHFRLSEDALARAPLDLLVWPETVYPTTFGTPKTEEGAAFDREIASFVAATGVPLVFGAYDVDAGGEFNAAVFLEPAADGRLEFETYRKSWLFPLTERVPAWLDGPRVRRWLPWLGTWRSGEGPQVTRLVLADGRVLRAAPLICYDAVVPDFAIAAAREGAELLLTLSNDAWFASGEGPHLHLVVSAFRSIETRRPQVRATNTGISALIAPDGELIALAGVHQRSALAGEVPAGARQGTLMLAWGDWFGPAALAAGALLLAVTRWRR
jgi:apolipoprotein N-acyltransferase